MSFCNDYASLDFYKQSLKGTVQDFIFAFKKEQTDIQQILNITLDLFEQLVESFTDKIISARLVAKVRFIHVNYVSNETEERFYHFSSYQSEKVYDVNDFFERHMTKIASRLDSFNANGSNLLIKNIAHIHVLLTLV